VGSCRGAAVPSNGRPGASVGRVTATGRDQGSSPTINPATSPAHMGKVAVEASDHALGGRHGDCGGRGRKARHEQKSCKPEVRYVATITQVLHRARSHAGDREGRHYGPVTAKAYAVFAALLMGFHNAKSGRCFPSYKAIAEAAAPSRDVRRTRARKASLPQRVLSTRRRSSGSRR
jgi:hypothetical protein